MNELVIMHDQQAVTTSLKVAEVFEKEHRNVMQSIKNLTAENSATRKMFAEDSYLNSRNQNFPMFYMNRDGFTLLAMGFTGSKAIEFKLKYIDAFNKMETYIKGNSAKLSTNKRLAIMEENAKTRKANLLYKIAMATRSETSKETLIAEAAKVLTGEMRIPVMKHKEFSATEIGKSLGISAKKVGMICNELGLKAEQPGQNEYGRWANSKSKHSDKEVPQWLYFEKSKQAIERYVRG